MSQLLTGCLISREQDHVHVIEKRQFAVDGSDVLAVFEANRLSFCECHSGSVGDSEVTRQSLERGRRFARSVSAVCCNVAADPAKSERPGLPCMRRRRSSRRFLPLNPDPGDATFMPAIRGPSLSVAMPAAVPTRRPLWVGPNILAGTRLFADVPKDSRWMACAAAQQRGPARHGLWYK